MLDVRFSAIAPDARAFVVPVRAGAIPAAFQAAADADGFTGVAETACQVLGRTGNVWLAGLGGTPDLLAFEAAGALAAARLLGVERIALDATGFSADEAVALATGACLRAWRYDRLRTKAGEDAAKLKILDLLSDDPDVHTVWPRQLAVLAGVTLTRDLVTEPSNTLTPENFEARLGALADAGVVIEVLDDDALRAQKFGALLAVGRASVHPPRLVVLRWAGAGGAAPVAFVGKGITFDTGGICIKPADHMWEMRADMAGAATCAGAMLALALRNAPAPAIAVLPLAENAVGGNAYRAGDVLKSFSGTTIQVVDTDAEGRLVLADALAYALTQKPRALIDLATLTGSIVTALGHHKAGAFDNNSSLADAAVSAGAAVGEFLWRMPIGESHRRALDSEIADIKHCVDEKMQPDACQAAAFLREFVCETPWLHLDIAGVESQEEATDRRAAGATGFGVRLLDRLMQRHFE